MVAGSFGGIKEVISRENSKEKLAGFQKNLLKKFRCKQIGERNCK